MTMATVELKDVTKSYGAVGVIRGIDLSIADGEFVVFVGPSGCGKSTLLYLIGGFIPIETGAVTVAGKLIHYTATPGTLTIRNDAGEPVASMFYTAYVADRAKGAQGQQHQGDADQRDIQPGAVGDAGAHAHDLRVAAVEGEAVVHGSGLQ